MKSVGSVESSFFVRRILDRGAFSTEQYPLKNSAILDSGTTIHIFNEISRFLDFRPADHGDFVWAGEHKVPIQGYGNVDIKVRDPKGAKILRLFDVAFCRNFASNLVSLQQLHKRGLWWDNRPGYNHLRRSDFSILALLQKHHGQFVLEYQPDEVSRAAFFTRRNKYNSWTKRSPAAGDALKWHLRLGHPGPGALEHLVNCSTGTKIRGPTTVECDACGQGKAKRKIRRAPKDLHEGPGYRLAIDFHDFNQAKGFTSLMLITDRWSGLCWDYYLSDRTAKTIITVLKHLFGTLKRQFNIEPKIAEVDNELTSQKPEVEAYLNSQFMKVEPSAPYTGAQLGGAERSGGVVKEKIRTMAIGANLPEKLWPEISRAAVYLHNRTPKYTYNWKSPYDRFHTHLAYRDGVVVVDRKPRQEHLKVFGCKAFAMTTEAKKKVNRRRRLNPKAWIGYLIGYDSTNIYRIWNPVLNKVFRTRDVDFNEDVVFDGKIPETELDELRNMIQEIEEPEVEGTPAEVLESDEPSLQVVIPVFHGDLDEYELIEDEELEPNDDPADLEYEAAKAFENPEDFYPTPNDTPPAALLAAAIRGTAGESEEGMNGPVSRFEPWKASFCAGSRTQHNSRKHRRKTIPENRTVNRARIKRILSQPNGLHKLHQRELPPEPNCHEDLEYHLLGKEFKKAEEDHIQSHIQMKTWTEVSRKDPAVKDHQMLDCMWVYVYKFDKHGRLAKCKARLVVRGDQQSKSMTGDTYAATLAARSFRVFIAIAARFDLELIQYDAVNAFVHATLDEKVCMKMPRGYTKPGTILKLNRALYGLRRSPILWQRLFYSSLLDIGFRPVPHEPCCVTHDGILIFFYVDDIVVAYKKDREPVVHEMLRKLKQQYHLDGGSELQWFLGIRVIRDRERRIIWLSQSTYIDKIANLATSTQPDTIPMTRDELKPNEDPATQRGVGRHVFCQKDQLASFLFPALILPQLPHLLR
jgi:hypothetical protein